MSDIKIEGPSSIPIEQPTYAPPPEAAPSPVKGPSMFVGTDGKVYQVPESSYNTAIKEGWKPATREDIIRENTIKERVKNTSQLEGGLQSFGNEALLGLPDYTHDRNSGPDEAKINQEVRDRVAARDPITHAAGVAAGFAAPLLLPGVGEIGEAARGAVEGGRVVARGAEELVAKGLVEHAAEQAVIKATETSVARKIAGTAVKYGVEGGLYATPKATVMAAYGDTEQAAETMLWSIGLSGVAGGVAGGLGQALKGAGKLVGKGIEEGQASLKKLISESSAELDTALLKPELSKLGPVPSEVASKFQAETVNKFPELGHWKYGMPKDDSIELVKKVTNMISDGGIEPSFSKLEAISKDLGKLRSKVETAVEGEAAKPDMRNGIIDLAQNMIQKTQTESMQAMYGSGYAPKKFADFVSAVGKSVVEKSASTVGGALGGVVGGYPGAAAGYMGGKVTGAVLNTFIKNNALDVKAASYLRKVLDNPETAPLIGGFMAKEGQAAFNKHLDAIPEMLASKPAKVTAFGATNAIGAFLGEEATGLSKDQQFKRVNDKINSMVVNPDVTSNSVGHIASVFTGTDTKLAAMVTQKKLNAIGYIASQLPKNPSGPQPFQQDDWKPNKQDQMIFERKLGICMNPAAIFAHIQDHSVTQADIDCLKAVYPKVYNQMAQRMLNAAYDPKTGKVSHNTRMAVSAFTGTPLDPSLKNLANIQTAITTPVGVQPKPPGKPAKASSRPKMDAPQLTTDVQRRSYGGSK